MYTIIPEKGDVAQNNILYCVCIPTDARLNLIN